jgi:hypothetical protein
LLPLIFYIPSSLYSFFVYINLLSANFCAIVKARDLSDHIWEFIGRNEALHFWVHLDATIQYFNFEPGIVHIFVSRVVTLVK